MQKTLTKEELDDREYFCRGMVIDLERFGRPEITHKSSWTPGGGNHDE